MLKIVFLRVICSLVSKNTYRAILLMLLTDLVEFCIVFKYVLKNKGGSHEQSSTAS